MKQFPENCMFVIRPHLPHLTIITIGATIAPAANNTTQNNIHTAFGVSVAEKTQ
jgi:hypothetical protein